MADIAGRIRSIEKKVDFIFKNMRMKAAVGNGLLDANGKPQVKVFEGSLEELYFLMKHLQDLPEDVIETLPAPIVAETIKDDHATN